MQGIKRIIVGIASLQGEDVALPGALALARRLGAELHVVHAYDLPHPIQAAYARELVLAPAVLEKYGEDLQKRLDASLAAVGGVSVFGHVVEGSAAECLDELVQELSADLLVLGATRRGRLWKQFLGITAEGVIRRSRVPVLVLRRSSDPPAHRILFTTDLSGTALAVQGDALALVRDLCGDSTVEMRTVLVVHQEAESLEVSPELLRGVARRELDRLLREVRERHGSPVGSGRIRLGETCDEIVAESMEWGADLIVVGTHSGSGPVRFHLGSVAGAVLRAAACDVLVIPSSRAARRARERERRVAVAAPAPQPAASFAGPRLLRARAETAAERFALTDGKG